MAGGAGPLTLGPDPAVDVPTAKEFIEEVHRHASREQLLEILAGLVLKAQGFARLLGRETIADLDDAGLGRVLRSIFASRRHADGWLARGDGPALREQVRVLLHSEDPVARRFDDFCEAVELGPEAAAETASELLHFTDPDRYWLWTRWIWSPDSRTGALPLVVSEDYDLEDAGDGLGAIYERVGAAMAAVDVSPEAASFGGPGPHRLGTDLFLVGVYAVYMNTVLGLKMSQEFNAVVPELPHLARRLLGTHAMEV